MPRHSWSKFFWSDWQRDSALHLCSLAARGLWMELLCQMDCSSERGFLVVAGRAASTAEIAKLIGAERRTVERLIRELERAGVFSRDERGAMFSRRMLRDQVAEERDHANGRKGGNPALLRRSAPDQRQDDAVPQEVDGDLRRFDGELRGSDGDLQQNGEASSNQINGLSQKGVIPPVKADKNQRRKEERREESSSSSGSGELALTPPAKPAVDQFDEFWLAYPRKVGKGHARTAWQVAIRKEAPDLIIAAVRRCAWQFNQYDPHPTTWLNGERWTDEPPASLDDALAASVGLHGHADPIQFGGNPTIDSTDHEWSELS